MYTQNNIYSTLYSAVVAGGRSYRDAVKIKKKQIIKLKLQIISCIEQLGFS